MTRRARRALGTLLAALACVAGAGCSIRYDAAGVTRVGIGLWGFGDPPGVNWNLDWPRRDVPDLPAGPRSELPPRPADFASRRADRGAGAAATKGNAPASGDVRR